MVGAGGQMEIDWSLAHDIFSAKEKHFQKERGADARELAALQVNRWMALLEAIADGLYKGPILTPGELVKALEESICQPANFKAKASSDGWVVQGTFPILPNMTHVGSDATTSIAFLAALLVESFDGLLTYSTNGETTLSSSLSRAYTPLLTAAMMDYVAYKRGRGLTEAISGNLKPIVEKLQEGQIAEEARENNWKELRQTAENFVHKIEQRTSEMVNRIEVEKTSMLDHMRKDVEALKESVKEEKFFQGAGAVWFDKRNAHKFAFRFWFTTLILSVLVIVVLLTFYGHSIIEIVLTKKPDGDYHYTSVVLLIVPGLALLWLLRFFGRFANNARTLADDSDQRAAMMETYFRLMADQKAEMRPADRILILNAIFRPLPGYQVDEVSPATLADLIKEATGLDGKAK